MQFLSINQNFCKVVLQLSDQENIISKLTKYKMHVFYLLSVVMYLWIPNKSTRVFVNFCKLCKKLINTVKFWKKIKLYMCKSLFFR